MAPREFARSDASSTPSMAVVEPAAEPAITPSVSRKPWDGSYGFLFQQLILKDFRIRYRNMSLGVMWSLLNPLVMMSVMTFIFGGVVGGGRSRTFPVFLLCGLVPYNFFTAAWITGTTSIIDSAPLVKRVPVPRQVLPIAAVLSNAVHLLIQIGLLFAMALIYGYRPNIHWFWLPLIWMLYMVFVCGLSLATSAINVFIRDTRYVIESFTVVLFWLVPIFYSFTIIPAKYAEIYKFNPVAALVMAMRDIMLEGTAPPMSLIRNLTLVAIVSITAGWYVFAWLKPRFYEHI